MYCIAEVDYKKLAKTNRKLAFWIESLKSKMVGEKKKLVMKSIGQSYKLNYLYYVKFFKEHKSTAVSLLGSKFAKDYNGLFYSEEIENDLIRQYIPAIYNKMNRTKIHPHLFEDCVAALLVGLRESVWKYQREDIKFCTYAIKGIENNLIFFKRQHSRNNKSTTVMQYYIEDFFYDHDTKNQDRLDILVDSSVPKQDQINIRDFIISIHVKADISPAQLRSIFAQIEGQPYDSKTFRKAKDKIALYISENRESLPELEEIIY